MGARTNIITLVCVSLLVMISCHGQHGDNNHGHGHSSENNHNHNSKDKPMKIEKPNRISHKYIQTINGSPKDIMPLYCPVRELDWCENWGPKAVYSNTGMVEKDCVFITSHGDDDIVWIVSDYDVEKGHVVMYYHVPGILVTKLEILADPIAVNKTKVTLTYSKTSLSETGDKVLDGFTKEEYDIMMDSWEKAMNHYLKTGKMLIGLPNF